MINVSFLLTVFHLRKLVMEDLGLEETQPCGAKGMHRFWQKMSLPLAAEDRIQILARYQG